MNWFLKLIDRFINPGKEREEMLERKRQTRRRRLLYGINWQRYGRKPSWAKRSRKKRARQGWL